MTMRVLPAIFVFSATALAATHAIAQGQPWLGDRRMGEGMGIRTGDFELHPGIAGEIGYDSNFYQAAGRVAREGSFNEPSIGVVRFRVTPSLTLKTLGQQRTESEGGPATPPKVTLEASVSGSYNEMIATDSTYSEAVSDDRYLSGDLGLNVEVLP